MPLKTRNLYVFDPISVKVVITVSVDFRSPLFQHTAVQPFVLLAPKARIMGCRNHAWGSAPMLACVTWQVKDEGLSAQEPAKRYIEPLTGPPNHPA